MARQVMRQRRREEGQFSNMIGEIFLSEFELPLNGVRALVLQRNEDVMMDMSVRSRA